MMASATSVTTLSIVALLLALVAVGVVFAIPGPQGPQGQQGIQGLTGPKGSNGTQGPPGVTYSPAPQERQFYILVIPDMGGDTYDIYLPSTITVNQGDNVSIIVRNTDGIDHGFELDAYHIINVTVSAAQDVNGTSVPTETQIPTFVATTPGVFQFFCSIYCGDGHSEMIGYLTVLPISSPSSTTAAASG